MILFNVCDIVDIGKSQDKGGYTFHMCKYWRALALLVNERGALLVKLSDVIAALSLACNVIRAVVDLIRFRQDKKRAATTLNSDGSSAEKHQ